MSDGTVVAPQSDGSYGMRFLDSGRVDIFADCNRVVGRFRLRGGNLHLRLGGASDLYCGPDSQSRIFIQDLRSFSDVMLQGNDLFLTLETDSGTMHFTRQ
jgi:heat shock protein HslJ